MKQNSTLSFLSYTRMDEYRKKTGISLNKWREWKSKKEFEAKKTKEKKESGSKRPHTLSPLPFFASSSLSFAGKELGTWKGDTLLQLT